MEKRVAKKVVQQIHQTKIYMKKLIQKIVCILLPASLILYSCCGSKSCSSNTNTKMEAKCNHCGNTTCDINCSASGKELKDSIKSISSCSLDSEAQSKRFIEIKKEIFSKSIRNKELKDGMEFTFQEPKEFNQTLLEFIEFERGCCKDFTFALHFEPRNGAVTLRMTGSSEIKEMIK